MGPHESASCASWDTWAAKVGRDCVLEHTLPADGVTDLSYCVFAGDSEPPGFNAIPGAADIGGSSATDRKAPHFLGKIAEHSPKAVLSGGSRGCV